MIEHAFRLTNGQDLKKEIENYCIKNQIQSCIIGTCVGCVKHLCLRLADGKTCKDFSNNFEIVSLVGTISNGKSHLHIVCSNQEASCLGGHLLEGTLINTTAEIVLLELETYHFHREYDENTGYKEIVITKRDAC